MPWTAIIRTVWWCTITTYSAQSESRARQKRDDDAGTAGSAVQGAMQKASGSAPNGSAVTSVLVEAMNIPKGSKRTSIRDMVAQKVSNSDISYVDFRKGNTKVLFFQYSK